MADRTDEQLTTEERTIIRAERLFSEDTVTTESLRQAAAAAGEGNGQNGAEPVKQIEIELAQGLDLIKHAETIGALESVKSTLIQNCQDTKRDFPIEWDAAIKDRFESINQLL